jgi:hypothetical protein
LSGESRRLADPEDAAGIDGDVAEVLTFDEGVPEVAGPTM